MPSREQLDANWELFEKFLGVTQSEGIETALSIYSSAVMFLQIEVPNLGAGTKETKAVGHLTPEDFELIAEYQQVRATEAEARMNFWDSVREEHKEGDD